MCRVTKLTRWTVNGSANYFLAGLLKPSYIPPKEQRQLRDLTRYRNKLIQQIASEKNRMMRILEDCNIKLSSVVSNTSGSTATSLIDMLCEGKKLTLDDIKSVYHGKLSAARKNCWKHAQDLLRNIISICFK